MGSKMGAADPNYPKIQGLSRLSRLSYGIAAGKTDACPAAALGVEQAVATTPSPRYHLFHILPLMKNIPRSLLCAVLLALLAGCASNATLRQRRVEANPEAYQRLSEADRRLVSQGKIREGMNKEGVFLSWGRPDEIRQGSKQKVPYEIWNYSAHRPHTHSHLSLGYDVYPYYFRRGPYYHYPHLTLGPAVTTTYVPIKVGSVEFLNDKVVSWEARKR